MDKFSIASSGHRLLITCCFLIIPLHGCKEKEVKTEVNELKTPNEISKVLVIPDAIKEDGNPPQATNTPNAPVIVNQTPEISGISGEEQLMKFEYRNASSNITNIYIQIEGADSYFRIPVSGNTGKSGIVSIPYQIPPQYTVPYDNCKSVFGGFMTFANGACVSIGDKSCFSSYPPPRPGKAGGSVNGQTFSANAVCEIFLPGFGKAFGIVTDDGRMIVLYNLKNGGNQLRDPFDDNSDITTTPWAGYVDVSGNIYFSTSGSAGYNGRVVSVSGTFVDFNGLSARVSASGNCQ